MIMLREPRIALVVPLMVAAVLAGCSSNSAGPPPAVTSLSVSGLPSSVIAGVATSVTITAKDASGSTATGYNGTVRFSSTDPGAQLPADYPFVTTDAGSHTFTVNFLTAGNQTVTATDAASSSLTGSQSVTVTPGRAFYVVNLMNSVTVYQVGQTGNAVPTATLAGSNTGLGPPGTQNPFGIGRDAAGQLYVTIDGANSVEVFAAGATGNAMPAAMIVGANTGLAVPRGIVLDAGGRLYVANSAQPCTGIACGSVTVYAAGASGNATPAATIAGSNTGLDGPHGVALFAGQLYVASLDSILVFAAGATGNAVPTATLAGSKTGLASPKGIALDAAGRLYVTNQGNSSVTVYAAGATGDTAPWPRSRAAIPG